ncbi:MAG: hypothetical protein KAS32_08235, partial [Candidatus Peribacteraceae bacterium]|nr:hypothetical protein [Candidatus Peribacteraceae bacterium]
MSIDTDITGYATAGNSVPIGNLDGATCTYAGGWAKDPDTTNAISVHMYFDNQGAFGTTANKNRTDVGLHAFHYVYSKDVLKIICDGGSHNVYAYGIDDKGEVGMNTKLIGSPKTVSSCGYYKEEGTKYKCCSSNNHILDSYGNCINSVDLCEEDRTKGGVCDIECGASICHGNKPGDSIPYCTMGGKYYILDRCDSRCMPVDRVTPICESGYQCSADDQCDGKTPGTGSCTSECKYIPSTINYYRKGIIYEEGGNTQINNQNDKSNCPTDKYCVHSERCYGIGTLRDVDGDGDKEYCGSYQRWFEVDSYGKTASDYPASRLSVLCDKLIGPDRWNIGGDAVSAKDDVTGWDHCCGDDEGEYFITHQGKTACCDFQTDILDSSGKCIVPPPELPPVEPVTDTVPIGYLDDASCSRAAGWAYDPDTTNAIS